VILTPRSSPPPAATPGNSGDAEVAENLLTDILPSGAEDRAAVYGDSAYGSGELLTRLDTAGVHNGIKVQPPAAVKGHFPKDRFSIDLEARTVTCPAGVTVPIRARERHAGQARFGAACATCALASQCTTATAGRTITISDHETFLAAARIRQADATWKANYRATRPKVERKIGHLMRRRHGGRRARVRGLAKVAADFSLLAAAVNLARLGALGIAHRAGGWVTSAA
jgi:hypothetical protein